MFFNRAEKDARDCVGVGFEQFGNQSSAHGVAKFGVSFVFLQLHIL